MVAREADASVFDRRQLGDLVPGGLDNVQDVYPLAPLQEGMLFHRLMNERGDTYVLSTAFELESAAIIPAMTAAIQQIVDRHDVLRTAVLWERLPRPIQVVYRRATVQVETVALECGRDPLQYVKQVMQPLRHQFDLRRAPLVRLLMVTSAECGRCYAVMQVHHIVCDHQSLRTLAAEAILILNHQELVLAAPVPYREYVENVLGDARQRLDESYFRSKLQDADEPTTPFGVTDVHGDGGRIDEAVHEIDAQLALQIRTEAQRSGVSSARLFHAAWGIVLARVCGRDDVVFGTVVLAGKRRNANGARGPGMFVNTLPLRLKLHDLTAADLVAHTHHELRELLEHENASLAMAQGRSGVAASAALFTALFNYRHSEPAPLDHVAAPGVRVLLHGEAWSGYPVAMTVDDLGEAFTLTAQVDCRIGAQRMNAYLETALHSLVDALEQEPSAAALSLRILPESERRRVIEQFNATTSPGPAIDDRPLHTLFEEKVCMAPTAKAVAYEGRVLSYAELNHSANQLASYLRRCGVATGDYVPVLMARSLQMLIAQLALLKLGAVYVPIDPEVPFERRTFMIGDCGARLLLAESAMRAHLIGQVERCVSCAVEADAISREDGANLGVEIEPQSPAYVMYTSGSTGVPKGVVVSHRAVRNLAVNPGYANIGPRDCIAHHSNPTFDASTFEVWGALLNGAAIVIVPQPVVLDPPKFARTLTEHGVTALYMSVGLFNQYTEALASVFPRLRYLMIGGEALEPGAVRRVLRASAPERLLNVYGPTECTTFATSYPVDETRAQAKSIPIGSPIANVRIYITSRDLEPVPIGATGEIYIGGTGVADGYLKRPELTAERFVRDPFSVDPQARMYRTGDLGFWRDDGTVEYLGRNDQQVKIRGFRIEPTEIEEQLLRHGQVKETAVIAREDVPGDKRLVAYVVPRSASSAPEVDELRGHLKRLLPEYMVPTAFMVLERMPLTSSGKVNRRGLPAPDLGAYVSTDYVPPAGDLECRLAEIWQDLLHVPQVGRSHDFFEIGGNSLSAMRLIVRIAETFAVPFSAQAVFRHPTLSAMVAEIEELQLSKQPASTAGGAEFEQGVL